MKQLRNSLFALLFLQACSEKKPLIATSKQVIYIDSIRLNETKRFYYVIYNKGNAVLKIESYTCSCDCTVPGIKPNQEIAPQDSLSITMSITPKALDVGKSVGVLCTFKTNADSMFTRLKIGYFVKRE